MGMFLTRLTLLMPTFSLLSTPPWLTPQLRRQENAPLPFLTSEKAIASVTGLSPDTLSAQHYSTSELLRTL